MSAQNIAFSIFMLKERIYQTEKGKPTRLINKIKETYDPNGNSLKINWDHHNVLIESKNNEKRANKLAFLFLLLLSVKDWSNAAIFHINVLI